MSDLEKSLFPLMRGEEPTIAKGVEGLLDLIKHKYIRREGSPGNYKYIYNEPNGMRGGAPVEDERTQSQIQEDELKQELLDMGFVEKLDHLPERTDKAHKDADGNYSQERRALHEKIIAETLGQGEPVPPDKKPVAILMMGGPGSGKSSATRGMDFTGFVPVDPDAIKAEIPEYQEATRTGAYEGDDGPKALNAAFMAHEESSDVADEIGQLAVAQRKNVLFDGTGKSLDKMQARVEKLKKEGYHIQILMPHLPVEEGKKRAAARAKKTGRWVPFSVLDEAYSKIPTNFMALSSQVDDAKVFDNNVAFGEDAKLMYSTSGGVPTVHDQGLFDSFQTHVNKSLSMRKSDGTEMVNPPMQEDGDKPPALSSEEIIAMFMQGMRHNAQDVEENGSKRVGAGPQPLLD